MFYARGTPVVSRQRLDLFWFVGGAIEDGSSCDLDCLIRASIWPRLSYICQDLALTVVYVPGSGLDCLICARIGGRAGPTSDVPFVSTIYILSLPSFHCLVPYIYVP